MTTVFYFGYNGDLPAFMSLGALLDNLALSEVARSIREDIETSVTDEGFWIGDIGYHMTVVTQEFLDKQAPKAQGAPQP